MSHTCQPAGTSVPVKRKHAKVLSPPMPHDVTHLAAAPTHKDSSSAPASDRKPLEPSHATALAATLQQTLCASMAPPKIKP